MTDRVAVLVNPAAGRGTAGRPGTVLIDRLRAAGIDARPVVGDDAENALDLLRAAVDGGAAGVVAAGGDGTVHLATNAVAGTDVPLGIVPLGTGNDVARCFGLPMSLGDAVEGIVSAVHDGTALRTVDAVTAGHGWYAGVLAAGFDARVNQRANRMSWPKGPRRYDLAVLAELGVLRPVPYVLELDGQREELEAVLVAVGNISSYGGGMRICDGAEPDDGLLDVLVARRVSRAQLLRLLPAVRSGRHLRHPAVELRRARTVSLAADGITTYADGERFAALPLSLEVRAGALRLLAADRRPRDRSTADRGPGRPRN